MFDNIMILRTANENSLIDIGLIAESLLFYDKVHLLLNRGTLHSLLNDLGAEGFDGLLDRPEIRVSFWNQNFGTVSNTNRGLRTHKFGVFEVGDNRKAKLKPADTIEQILERTVGKASTTRKRIRKIVSRMSFPRIDDTITPEQFVEGARSDLDDPSFLQNAIGIALTNLLPDVRLPQHWNFAGLRLNDGSFAVDTNLDFHALNLEYHRRVPPEHSSISPEYLLTFIFDAHAGTFFASRYLSELVHDPLCASVMKIKYLGLMRKRDKAIEEIDLFQDLHLGAKTIREAINTKERSLTDFFELLDSAEKFKGWLREKNPDEKLLKEYFDAVTRETWIDKLPSKSARWIITTGLAAAVESFYPTGAAMAAAQGVSLVDATLLDNILKGWRPNQFVNGPWSKFVGKE